MSVNTYTYENILSFRSMSNRYMSYSFEKSGCFNGKGMDKDWRTLSYLEWSTQFQSTSHNDSDITFRLLNAETDRGDVENNPSRMAIKQKSKDRFVREDFFKAMWFEGMIKMFTIMILKFFYSRLINITIVFL